MSKGIVEKYASPVDAIYDIRGGVYFFCMLLELWHIMIVLKCLAARSSIVDVFIFAFEGFFSWIEAVG
jgi:hypothetical protein